MKDQAPSWEQCDWPDLLDAARADIDEALNEVFRRLSAYCRMVAASDLGADLVAKVSASDIAQTSLMEAFARFRTFSGRTEAELRSWLATIVSHNVIDAARRYRTAGQRAQLREERLEGRHDGASLRGRTPSPSLALRRQETDVALQRAISQLPEKQLRAVELRYREGLDYRQIASAMEISEPAARKLCSRAIGALRIHLAADGRAEDETRI
jgi:RNA polymerase sigma-70 factor, ECF subfamily